jgi:hypothetical protein
MLGLKSFKFISTKTGVFPLNTTAWATTEQVYPDIIISDLVIPVDSIRNFNADLPYEYENACLNPNFSAKLLSNLFTADLFIFIVSNMS